MKNGRRDFRRELRADKCWDRTTEALFEAHGEPLEDCILQNREELIGLCELIETHGIRSYLEIGIWTGRTLSALQRIFEFDLVAACDHGWAEQCGLSIRVPPETHLLRADSWSDEYRAWRAELGSIDLVLIDGDHRLEAVRRDFAINRTFPHRFLAFHDICGARPQTRGVKQLWDEIDEGFKQEIVRPHLELGLDHSIMGIGVWSEDEPPG